MDSCGRIIILGSGNVATHLATTLAGSGMLAGLWSRTPANAAALADRLHVPAYADITDIPRDADVYIIAVADRAVADVACRLGAVDGIVAHTSGSVPMQALAAGGASRTGVFYPLQTFSKDSTVDMSQVPFFIEASEDDVFDTLSALARQTGGAAYAADSSHRAVLHLAAVFACNFANRLWGIADELLAPAGYPLTVFSPLLTETLRKAMAVGPSAAQTGPAVRNDSNVIRKQLDELGDGANAELYRIFTAQIQAIARKQSEIK